MSGQSTVWMCKAGAFFLLVGAALWLTVASSSFWINEQHSLSWISGWIERAKGLSGRKPEINAGLPLSSHDQAMHLMNRRNESVSGDGRRLGFNDDLTTSGSLEVTSDQKKRLRAQNRIGYQWPWFRVEMVGTHNSYNAFKDGYKVRENHHASLKNQLNAGIRLINFDVKEYFVCGVGCKKLLLCHSKGSSFCDPFSDRTLKDGLRDIRGFLNEDGNENEFVMLVIEDSTGKSNAPANDLREVFGSKLYMPLDHSSSNSGCEFPMHRTDRTREWLIARGYQVMAVFNADGSDGGCNYKNDKFKKTIFKVPIISDKGGSQAKSSNRNPINAKIYRPNHYAVWEDRAFGTSDGDKLSTDEIVPILKGNGYNQLGLDFALKNDKRFEKLLWSWGANEPLSTGGNCAAIMGQEGDGDKKGQWYASDCSLTYRAVCRKETYDAEHGQFYSSWKLTNSNVTFTDAIQACKNSHGTDWHFQPPINGYEHYRVLDLRNSYPGVGDGMWVNYWKSNGEWRS